MVGHYQPQGGWPYAAAISGQHLFLANRGSGIQVLDISNPAAPAEIGSLAITGVDFVFDLHLVGSRLYVAADVHGLRIIDVGNSALAARIRAADLPD